MILRRAEMWSQGLDLCIVLSTFLEMIKTYVIVFCPLIHMKTIFFFTHYAILSLCQSMWLQGGVICKPRFKSCKTLHLYVTGCSMPHIFPFGLMVQKILKTCPIFGPFLGGRAICNPRDFIWIKLNLLVPGVLHANLKCILASGSWKDFLSYLLYIYIYIHNYVLLGQGHLWPKELYLHKLESPFPKDALYQISMHLIGPVVCDRNIFQIPNLFPILASL